MSKQQILDLLSKKKNIEESISQLRVEWEELHKEYPIFCEIGISPEHFKDAQGASEFVTLSNRINNLSNQIVVDREVINLLLGGKTVCVSLGHYLYVDRYYHEDEPQERLKVLKELL